MAQRHERREMERLLRKRDRQSLTYRELSEDSGIPIPTLSWWSRKLTREVEAQVQACEFVPVKIVEDELHERDAAIEIIVAGRLKLLVPPAASEDHLQRVLRAVASC